MGGQGLVGIRAQLFVPRKDSLLTEVAIKRAFSSGEFFFVQTKVEISHCALDFLPGFQRDFLFEADVVIGGKLTALVLPKARHEPLEQFGFALLEQRSQGAGHFGLPIDHQGRVGADGLDEGAGCQKVAASVQDVASPGFQEQFLLGVLQRLGAQFLVADHLQNEQPETEPGKGCQKQRHEHEQPVILGLLAMLKAPHARADRFLVRRRHGRRQNGFAVVVHFSGSFRSNFHPSSWRN